MAAAGRQRAGIVGQGRPRQELRRYREVSVRLLLLGAGGQVGRAVISAVPAGHQVIAKTRAELDIADARAVERVFAQAKPDWIVNAAAYTAVDLAEDQPDEATQINDTAVGVLAQAALRGGARLLHLSTDF